MNTLVVEDFLVVTIGIVVYFLGAFLTRHIAFLRNYNIPEPVSGGLAVAMVTWGIYVFLDTEIVFTMNTRNKLLAIFFTTIGLNARIKDLIVGGRTLLLLLGLTMVFMVLQNVVGTLGVTMFGMPKETGVLIGSASLIGGHGTAIAWGPTIQDKTGFEAAPEIGIAAATLGLIFAALLGGPIAKFLIDRHGLKPKEGDDPIVGLPFESEDKPESAITHIDIMRSILAIHVAIIFGYIANAEIAALGLKLPLFVPCLLVAIVMSNLIPVLFKSWTWPARTPAMTVISDYSLSVFLAISLMSMKLWAVVDLGAPLVIVLLLQVIMTSAFILVILFRLLKSDYTASVLSAGFAGFALGATPTAIANMSSVTKRYGPAPLAFVLLPLISAFFVDLANALIIQFFVS